MTRLLAAGAEIFREVRAAQGVLVFLDYDGTLVPIRPTPERARLSPERKKILTGLARLPRFNAGLLTGRSLKDIRKAAGIPGLFYAANYGLVIVTPQKQWVHPEAKSRVSLLKRMLPRLRRLESEFPGVRIEDKTWTVAIHYRQHHRKPEVLRKKLEQIISARLRGFELKTGKKVFEVYPAVKWDKGRALLKVQEMLGYQKAPLVIFVGDDRADEEAFRQMRKTDLAAVVGRREKTAARFFCQNSGEVFRFLKSVLKAERDSKL